VLFTVGVFALMPALDPPHGPQPEFSGALRSLHAATILQAYGAFGLAAVAASMFLAQQRDLKVHKLRALLSLLPSMQRLELVTHRLVLVGFALLAALAALPVPLLATCLVIFVLAWIGQFIGHKVEGKKPSFLKDVVFLLIGPAWLLSKVYRKIGLKY